MRTPPVAPTHPLMLSIASDPGRRWRDLVRVLVVAIGLALAMAIPAATPAAALGDEITQISAGPAHACAVKSSGLVYCWGRNHKGQLGDGTTQTRRTPVKVVVRMGERGGAQLKGVVEVAAGLESTCARRSNDTVWCWGSDGSGQLGNGPGSPSTIKVAVKVALPDAKKPLQITAGWYHACARTTGHSTYCWGGNNYGQLGDGTFTSRAAPVSVGLTSNVAAGPYHTCGAGGPGALCWGRNNQGQLGHGALNQSSKSPQPVRRNNSTDLKDVSQLTVGTSHSCARMTNRTIRCWGLGSSGQLGNNSTGPTQRADTAVKSMDTAAHLASGDNHSCARTTDRRVWCWGSNDDRQLGKGSAVTFKKKPVRVAGLTNVTHVAVNGTFADGGYSCALKSDRTVWCWGSNTKGQLGRGGSGKSKDPQRVRF
ncbi:MAG: hypothetical protein KF809_06240 [Chloroflexi bacterium]|nr:hypothetical protein [Chloroflexota bacterium]